MTDQFPAYHYQVIARALDIGVRTVETHRQNIRRKLDLAGQAELIRYAVEQGNTVFLVSWRNPNQELAGISWDDYVERGAIEAIKVALIRDAAFYNELEGMATALATKVRSGVP